MDMRLVEMAKKDIKVGEYVKVAPELRLNFIPEAFWVQVVEILPDGDSFIGRVSSHLVEEWGYNYNDLVAFEMDDVALNSIKKHIDASSPFS